MPGGRPPGAKNLRSARWEEFGDWFILEGTKRLQEEMGKLKGKEFVLTVKDLMEYFQPKLARSEITGKDGKDFIPTPIINALPENNSNQPSNGTQEQNQGNTRGNLSLQDSIDSALPDSASSVG